MKKNILFFVAIVLFLNTHSQTVGVTNFMRLSPYSILNNPAYFLPYKGYVALPVISNLNFSIYNSGFSYNELFSADRVNGKPTRFSFNNIEKSLHGKNNFLGGNMNFQLLGFGFRVKDLFFAFDYRFIMEGSFKYNKEIFTFLNDCEQGRAYKYTQGSPVILDISPNLNIYQEMGLGIQAQITKRLYIGIKPKILFGIFNIKTDKLNAELCTNINEKTLYGNLDVDIKLASAIPFYERTSDGDIAFNFNNFNISDMALNCFSKNLGFAIDLGAVFRINQQIRVSASVTDLGFIKWKGVPMNYSIQTTGSRFKDMGFTYEQILEIFNHLDFNKEEFRFSVDGISSYKTMLTTKLMADIYFDLTPSNRFIFQMKGHFIGKNLLPQFTVAYNGTFFNVIDIVISYSLLKKSFDNIGLGLGLRLGPIHLYAGTDNVLSAFKILNAKRMNVTTGVLIDFPITKKVKEKELWSFFGNKKDKQENE